MFNIGKAIWFIYRIISKHIFPFTGVLRRLDACEKWEIPDPNNSVGKYKNMCKYKRLSNRWRVSALFLLLMIGQVVLAGQGKLLETAGLTQVEGSGGGGIVPWATISGYDSRDETSASVFNTLVFLDDYRLHSWGEA